MPFVELLESAYDASIEPERFDDLMTLAKKYLFEDEATAAIRVSLPRHAAAQDALDKRTEQLSKLLDAQLSGDAGPDMDTFHARISISPKSLLVKGNEAAAELVGRVFPCPFDDLPFDHATMRIIEAGLKANRKAEYPKDQIFLTQIEQPQLRSCLALIERPSFEGQGLEIAISYIHWSEELLDRLRDAFGLTKTQVAILAGFLNNQSRKAIAEERGISTETVKDHSRAILQKTGCSRMNDVVQLSASIAYLLRQYRRSNKTSSLSNWNTPEDNLKLLQRPNGRTLAWYEYGNGNNAVLFVHGYIQGPFFSNNFLTGIEQMGLRLICPSRPGYGYSSPSSSRKNFEDTFVSDTFALVEALEIGKLTIVAHQGGTSHAFRIANALGTRVSSLLMIDGGIPIDEKRYLAHMNDFARIGAVACKHAPSIMTMLMNLGLPIQKKRGIERFLHEYHKTSPIDMASIEDPDILRMNAYGCFHSMEQGAEAWVRDGASAMADWSADFDVLTVPQYWIHPKECPVMGAQFVEEYIARKLGQEIEIVPDAAFNILYQQPDIVLNFLDRHLKT